MAELTVYHTPITTKYVDNYYHLATCKFYTDRRPDKMVEADRFDYESPEKAKQKLLDFLSCGGAHDLIEIKVD